MLTKMISYYFLLTVLFLTIFDIQFYTLDFYGFKLKLILKKMYGEQFLQARNCIKGEKNLE